MASPPASAPTAAQTDRRWAGRGDVVHADEQPRPGGTDHGRPGRDDGRGEPDRGELRPPRRGGAPQRAGHQLPLRLRHHARLRGAHPDPGGRREPRRGARIGGGHRPGPTDPLPLPPARDQRRRHQRGCRSHLHHRPARSPRPARNPDCRLGTVRRTAGNDRRHQPGRSPHGHRPTGCDRRAGGRRPDLWPSRGRPDLRGGRQRHRARRSRPRPPAWRGRGRPALRRRGRRPSARRHRPRRSSVRRARTSCSEGRVAM